MTRLLKMNRNYTTRTYEITDRYKEIMILAKDAKVSIEPSNDNNTKLAIYEKKRQPYSFFLQNDVLTIAPTKTKWYHLLRIGINHTEIKLYVPKLVLENIMVKSNSGHIDIASLACNGSISIQTNTGRISLENISCQNFETKGNTGSLSLNKISAKESIFIKLNTGNVLVNDCSAPNIIIKTNTGKVRGKLPSNTVFTARTNTGKIDIPTAPIGEVIGARCEIKTNTGSIKFE